MIRRRLLLVLRIAMIFILCAVLVPVTVGGTALAAFFFLPLPAELPEPKVTEVSQVSRIYDAGGNQIGTFRQFEQSIPVKKSNIPEVLKQAVISAEDRNFYSHGGVDLRGSFRALYADIRNQRLAQGGSTITQQYVKKAYVGDERTIQRKVKEAVLASQLDRQEDKEEILFRYLSIVYLGEGAYGVGAAAETYFRKPVAELNASESAVLAGVIPAPTRLAPRSNPQGAENKRKIVLKSMHDEGYLTDKQYDEAVAQPIWLSSQGPPPGPVTLIHPPEQPVTNYPYFVDYVRRYLVVKYGADKVFRGGLRIQTTLDPRIQSAAEAEIAAGLKGTTAPLEMSLVAVEPQTGFVKALVGGRDFNSAQVNLALGGCPQKRTDITIQVEASCWSEPTVVGGGTGRQPGSSWKPIVLAAAYKKGIPPSRVYSGAPYRIPNCRGTKCSIQNFGGASYGRLSLKEATKNSVNGVYARLIQDVGFAETGQMARDLGLTSAWYSDDFHTQAGSYSLGVVETSPLDMASAFGVFANRGLRYPATPIVRVVDGEGRVLEDNTKREPIRVLEENVADNVNDTLQGVVQGGTAARRGQIGRPAAGKTGTNTDSSDAWFVGYTPTLSTAVWVGYSNSRKSVRLPGFGLVEGGELPTQTWARFMRAALENVPIDDFSDPAPIKAPAGIEKVTGSKARRTTVEPGKRRSPSGTPPGGPYVVSASGASASPPTTSTMPSTTTSTTPASP